jgi:hypothetical protein
MQIASIGIDLGKTTFHLVALGERSKVLVESNRLENWRRPPRSTPCLWFYKRDLRSQL